MLNSSDSERFLARMEVVEQFMSSNHSGFLSVDENHLSYLSGAIWQLYVNEYEKETVGQSEISSAIFNAYFASLEIDEGRYFPFSVLLVPEGFDGVVKSRFSNELDLTARNIAKLAPALLHTRRSILVQPKEGVLRIVGVGERAEGILELSSLREGSLSLKFPSQKRDNIVVALVNKKTVVVEPDFGNLPFDNELALGRRNGISGEFATRFGFVYEILRRIYSFQRGGILIISSDESWSNSVLFGNGFDLDGEMVFGALSDSIIGGDIDSAIRSGYANDIASLSRIDGATIIKPDFRVLSFGAKLQPIDSQDLIESYLEVGPGLEAGMGNLMGKLRDNHRSIGEVGGTRHRSSAQFAYDHHGSVVFTASEDGPISIFFWSEEDETVVRVRNSEAFIL